MNEEKKIEWKTLEVVEVDLDEYEEKIVANARSIGGCGCGCCIVW